MGTHPTFAWNLRDLCHRAWRCYVQCRHHSRPLGCTILSVLRTSAGIILCCLTWPLPPVQTIYLFLSGVLAGSMSWRPTDVHDPVLERRHPCLLFHWQVDICFLLVVLTLPLCLSLKFSHQWTRWYLFFTYCIVETRSSQVYWTVFELLVTQPAVCKWIPRCGVKIDVKR